MVVFLAVRVRVPSLGRASRGAHVRLYCLDCVIAPLRPGSCRPRLPIRAIAHAIHAYPPISIPNRAQCHGRPAGPRPPSSQPKARVPDTRRHQYAALHPGNQSPWFSVALRSSPAPVKSPCTSAAIDQGVHIRIYKNAPAVSPKSTDTKRTYVTERRAINNMKKTHTSPPSSASSKQLSKASALARSLDRRSGRSQRSSADTAADTRCYCSY